MTDKELFAALLLLQNLLVVKQHYGVTLSAEFPEDSNNELFNIGCGLGTLQSYLNHSCDANTILMSDRRRSLIYCMRPIKAGEQVCTQSFL